MLGTTSKHARELLKRLPQRMPIVMRAKIMDKHFTGNALRPGPLTYEQYLAFAKARSEARWHHKISVIPLRKSDFEQSQLDDKHAVVRLDDKHAAEPVHMGARRNARLVRGEAGAFAGLVPGPHPSR